MKWLRFMDQRSYVHGELTDLYKIIELLNDTLSSQIGGKHHDALIGLYLSNIYMGVERLLRLKLKAQNIKIQKKMIFFLKSPCSFLLLLVISL